jgi:hypothetical protein
MIHNDDLSPLPRWQGITNPFDPEEPYTMAYQLRGTQMRSYSETKLFRIHRWVLLPTVPPKIILPNDWFIVFVAALDGTNPIDLAIFMR